MGMMFVGRDMCIVVRFFVVAFGRDGVASVLMEFLSILFLNGVVMGELMDVYMLLGFILFFGLMLF